LCFTHVYFDVVFEKNFAGMADSSNCCLQCDISITISILSSCCHSFQQLFSDLASVLCTWQIPAVMLVTRVVPMSSVYKD